MMTTTVFLFALIYVLTIQNVEPSELVCPKHVTGILGGSINIKCFYSIITPANKYTRKYFCLQGGQTKRCKPVIISTNFVHPSFLGRAFIVDDQKGTITITLDDLKMTDQGIYICGIGLDTVGFKETISVSVTEDSVIPVEAELVYGQLRGIMKFSCKFDKQNADQRKYLCKLEKHGCRDIVDSFGKKAPDYEGRIMLQTDKTEPGSFTVKIIQLRNEDTGYFSCGYGTYGTNDGDAVHFDLRISKETDIPQGSRSLSPRLGGSVSAQCNYNPKKNYTDKFWCKLEGSVCNPIATTSGYVKDVYEGRVLIHDNATNGIMQVLMNQITKEDEGWYWCVLTDGKDDQTSTVQLRISEDDLQGLSGDQLITLTAGETAKIPCSYPCRYKSYEMYWCKLKSTDCEVLSRDDGQNGLSISCETQELVLNIDSVKQKDSGWYWCGVMKSGRYGETMAVQIIVNEPSETRSINNQRSNVIADNRNNQVIVTPPSTDSSKNSTLVAVIISLCAAVLVVSAVFIFFRIRRKNNSDLVSVGSYRTNISMTDLDNGIGKENPGVTETQETDISHTKDELKVNKKGSREDLDYSSFLIQHNGSPNEDLTA